MGAAARLRRPHVDSVLGDRAWSLNKCDIAFLPDEGGLAVWGCPTCTPGEGALHYLGCELIGWNVPLARGPETSR
jgi:hypothetical protein